MAIDPTLSQLSDEDLNGLVEGDREGRRHHDVLRYLRSHPAEAARVAALRNQSDLLKAVFSEVEHEPVPVSLRLTPPPLLRCVDDTSSDYASRAGTVASSPVEEARYRQPLAIAFCAAFVFVALASWVLVTQTLSRPSPISIGPDAASDIRPMLKSVATISANQDDVGDLRGSPDLPLSTIPDLRREGLVFTGASREATRLGRLSFFYADANGGRIALGVSKTREVGAVDRRGHLASNFETLGIAWQRGGLDFSLSGDINNSRLSEIANDLRKRGEPLP